MIKIDMKMPKCCDDCPMLNDDGDYPTCRVTQTSRGYDFPKLEKRMDDCPLRDEDFQGIHNAKIMDTSITMADHGCLTFFLTIEGEGSWGVGIGGYSIAYGYLGSDEFKAESGAGLEAMMRIMDTVGVDRWEDLKGKYIRVKGDIYGSGSIEIIGNLLEDKWFNLKKFFRLKSEEQKGKSDAKNK